MKKNRIIINHSFSITDITTYEMFQKSNLYSGQSDNRFFWIKDFCEIEGFQSKFKIGLCFRNNLITRIELFCADQNIIEEETRYKINNLIIQKIKNEYDLKYKNIENSFDKRNNYSSIIITF